MRPWKAAVGVGAACAACCAIPLFGGAAALTAGSTAIAAIGASLATCADEFALLGAVLLVVALGGGLMAWRRRRSALGNSQVSACSGACNANDQAALLACALPSDQLAERLSWIRRVTSHGLVTHRRDGASLRLSCKLSSLPDLQRLVALEALCCPHLSFSLNRAAGMAILVITALEGHESEADWLFAQFVPLQVQGPAKACGCAPGACG